MKMECACSSTHSSERDCIWRDLFSEEAQLGEPLATYKVTEGRMADPAPKAD
jgi:hypothetical protein